MSHAIIKFTLSVLTIMGLVIMNIVFFCVAHYNNYDPIAFGDSMLPPVPCYLSQIKTITFHSSS